MLSFVIEWEQYGYFYISFSKIYLYACIIFLWFLCERRRWLFERTGKKWYISHAGLGCKEKVLVVCITVTVVLLLHLLSCFLHNIVQQHTANFFTLQKKNEEGTKQKCSSGLCFTITPITPLVTHWLICKLNLWGQRIWGQTSCFTNPDSL